ncbi:ATP synthase subunit I [Lyngbya confervoides]|uniref:ATP synthase subunit I n=1 Tax=Lyngbya confervoides BDU141951 TaxID=1574623 RepID=A0ABD4T915_9CYAN|nr:ATP synthase subunit I [Lyngbya confervoides]MCM1984938.1 ATP synthase subunit I [Lyngbya confervoides BDU141951]
MIHLPIPLILTLVWGGLLGLLYFGGLWWTVREIHRAKRPFLRVAVSYLLRLGAVLGGFHLILQRAESPQILPLLLLSFVGFLGSRTLLIQALRPRDRPKT